MTCDYWECSNFAECKERLTYSGAKYPPCAMCFHFDRCDLCKNYIDCADLVTRYLPNMFRRLVLEIRHGEDTNRTEQYIRIHTHGGKKRD